MAGSEFKVLVILGPHGFYACRPDFGASMGEAKAKAHEMYMSLKTSHNVLADYGRINGDISPEQKQARKEEDRRVWLETGRHIAPSGYWVLA